MEIQSAQIAGEYFEQTEKSKQKWGLNYRAFYDVCFIKEEKNYIIVDYFDRDEYFAKHCCIITEHNQIPNMRVVCHKSKCERIEYKLNPNYKD